MHPLFYIVRVCCAGEHLCEVNLSHDPLGRLLVLVLLPHVLQGGVMAAQLRLDFLPSAQGRKKKPKTL